MKSALGVKLMPARAALTSLINPVNDIDTSPVPLPLTNASPLVPLSVMVPLVAVSVICTALAPASTSLMLIRFALPAEKTSGVSSLVLCAPGTELTGASLTALTVMLTVSVSVIAPPVPLLPWSSVLI